MSAALPPAVFARHEQVCPAGGVVGRVSAGLIAVVRATTGAQRVVLQIYRPGDVIGAHALLSSQDAGDQAQHDTRLEALVPTAVEWIAAPPVRGTELPRAILAVTAARARYQEYAAWRRREQTAPQRVAQLLAGLAHDPVHGVDRGVAHRLRRADVAILVGTTKSTVGETYQQFARRGWITVAGHSLSAIEVEALRQHAARDTGPAAYPDAPLIEAQARLWRLLDRR